MIVVGQTPPPVPGQAIMIQRLLKLNIPGVEMHHVPMRFSGQVSEIGRIRLWKLIEGLKSSFQSPQRLRTGAEILYYPPADRHHGAQQARSSSRFEERMKILTSA
jgi:hypothetical protein